MLRKVFINQTEELLTDIVSDGGVKWRIVVDNVAFAGAFRFRRCYIVLQVGVVTAFLQRFVIRSYSVVEFGLIT